MKTEAHSGSVAEGEEVGPGKKRAEVALPLTLLCIVSITPVNHGLTLLNGKLQK